MSKVTVNINEVIAKVEEAYEEVRKTSKIVLQDFHRVKPTADEYRGKYCYPFFKTGDYYTEKDRSHGQKYNNTWHTKLIIKPSNNIMSMISTPINGRSREPTIHRCT